MKGNGPVVKGLLMITQIGISMIVPIFLGAYLGHRIDRWLGTGFFFLIFLFFGILAAFRNIYKLTKPFYAEDLKRERAEQAYWDSLRNGREAGPQEGQMDRPQCGENEASVLESCTEVSFMDSSEEVQKKEMPLLDSGGEAPKVGTLLLKSRREAAEEEFAAWRREREKNHDGGISHDKAGSHGSTAHDGGAVRADGTGRDGAE